MKKSCEIGNIVIAYKQDGCAKEKLVHLIASLLLDQLFRLEDNVEDEC